MCEAIKTEYHCCCTDSNLVFDVLNHCHFSSDVSFMIVGERRESKRKGWLLLLLLLLKVKTNCKMSQQKEFSYTQFNTRIDSSTRIFEVILWLCFYWIQLWRFSSDCVDIHTLIAVSKKFFASWVSFLSFFSL